MRARDVNNGLHGTAVARTEFYAGAGVGSTVVQNELADFVVNVEIEVSGKFVTSDEDNIIEAFADWDENFNGISGSADTARICGGHVETALGVADGHVVALVLGLGRIGMNRAKREEQRTTA